jgi:hypothetical protein
MLPKVRGKLQLRVDEKRRVKKVEEGAMEFSEEYFVIFVRVVQGVESSRFRW